MSRSARSAPQLIPGTVCGVREWEMIPEVGSGRVLLASLAQHTVWPTSEAEAECIGNHSGTAIPSPTCSCGIYAFHPYDFEDAFEVDVAADEDRALGVIEAWGRIEVHASGIRAQRARVRSLLVPGDCRPDHLDEVGRAAATYGADLVRIGRPSHLAEYLRETPSLDEGFVEDLLARDQRFVFEASARGYISRRGQPVGGLGFVPCEAPEPPQRFEPEVHTGLLGLQIVRVAGPQHHRRDLQRSGFNLGAELALVPEPSNAHDPNAIAVMDATRTYRAGYVPRELAPRIARRLGAGRVATVRSIWQWSDLRTRRRTGLHILISSTRRVEFADREQLILGDGAA